MDPRRGLPKVDALMLQLEPGGWSARVRAKAARQAIAEAREALAQGTSADIGTRASELAKQFARPTLRPAINAGGVVLHTGLGRARLAQPAAEAVARAAADHVNVELDLETGGRGDRQAHVRELLRELTGCEDALVVNNCAGAVYLTLKALCEDRDVLLSRGQMVEIGGAFRMPDVVRSSGCRLVEVGCTNKTRLSDYAEAGAGPGGAVLRCHPSNFRIVGFVEEPTARELADWAHGSGLLLIDDVGSGCLVDTTRYGLEPEPTLGQSLAAGADVVMASGDKLLGGPQAGLILGRAAPLERIRRHPMARALRVDKLTLAGLAATLNLYAEGRADEVPVWRYLGRTLAGVKQDADRLAECWPGARVESGGTEVGGGSLPGNAVPTWRVGLPSSSADELAHDLRQNEPAIVPRIEDGLVWLDPRTMEPDEVGLVQQALRRLHDARR